MRFCVIRIEYGRLTLVYCICEEDIKFEIQWWVSVEKPWAISQYLARISHVRASRRWKLGSYRFGLVEDI
jgi:hypothetical protein